MNKLSATLSGALLGLSLSTQAIANKTSSEVSELTGYFETLLDTNGMVAYNVVDGKIVSRDGNHAISISDLLGSQKPTCNTIDGFNHSIVYTASLQQGLVPEAYVTNSSVDQEVLKMLKKGCSEYNK